MHYLSSVYFLNEPLHVSGISVAHHQEIYCIYEGESKSKGKIHLTVLIEVTASNFTYHFST